MDKDQLMNPSNFQDTEYNRFHNTEVQATRHHPRAEEFEYGWILNREREHLFYRGWKLKNTTIPHSPHIILHIHGMISHSEPYIALADCLVNEEILMYGLDLIGHGHSDGRRGDYRSFTLFLQNIEDMLGWLAQKYPNATFHLSGESMGGVATTLYLCTRYLEAPTVSIRKALMWAPAYEVVINKPSLAEIWNGITMIFKLIFCPHRASIKATHINTFRDPISQHFDEVDPHNLSHFSVRYLLNINWGMQKLKKIHAPSIIRTPFCIIHGLADRIAAQPASKKFFETSVILNQCLYLAIPDAWHCIYKDPSFSEDYWHKIQQFLVQ